MCNAEDRNKASSCPVSVLPLVLEPETRGRRPVPRHGMSLSVDSAPLAIERGRALSNSSAVPRPPRLPPPAMYTVWWIIDLSTYLAAETPITLFQPAHSVMQAGMLGS